MDMELDDQPIPLVLVSRPSPRGDEASTAEPAAKSSTEAPINERLSSPEATTATDAAPATKSTTKSKKSPKTKSTTKDKQPANERNLRKKTKTPKYVVEEDAEDED